MSSSDGWRDSYVDLLDVRERLPMDDEVAVELSLAAIRQSRQAVCITDATIDSPGPIIEFVNQAYLDIFGCEQHEVLGESPRFGQGPLTDRTVLDRIRLHLVAGEPVQAQAINYRFDRSVFRLRWTIDPVYRGGELAHFVAMMRDVTTEDRMRRRLAALDTLVSMTRPAAYVSGAERERTTADAMASALGPIVSELAAASVRVGSAVSSIAAPEAFDDAALVRSTVAIGGIGEVELRVHEDATPLVDVLGIRELAAQVEWVMELPTPRA